MTFAFIQGGVVAELFEEFVSAEFPGVATEEDPNPAPQVRSVPLSERFHPDFVAALVQVPNGQTVSPGDSYDGTTFGPPPAPPVPPPPTAAETLAQRDALLKMATLRIDPLADAVEFDEATPAEIAALKAWRQYRIALNRIEQQAGFPAAVDWPQAPA